MPNATARAIRRNTTTSKNRETEMTKNEANGNGTGFDWSGVTVAETEEAISFERRGRTSTLHLTPFPGWLEESRKNGTTKILKDLPADKAREAINLIRASAARAGHGVSVQPTSVAENHTGTVTVKFRAKDKRAHTESRKTTCPECGNEVVVSQDGTLRTHGPRNARCPGTGAKV